MDLCRPMFIYRYIHVYVFQMHWTCNHSNLVRMSGIGIENVIKVCYLRRIDILEPAQTDVEVLSYRAER